MASAALGAAPPDAAHDRHGNEIIRFDDPRNDRIPKFEYEPLSNMTSRIRLLRLMAGKQDTPDVECQLFEAHIKPSTAWRISDIRGEPIEVEEGYEALSWSWGTDPLDYQILLRKGGARSRLRASPGLVWALKYLRRPDKDRTLWIDAICINQKDVDEKNYQVQLMSQIYSYATNVCIWLGLDDEHSHKAIKFIQDEILQLQHFDMLCEDEKNSQKWQSLLLLMQRQWFFRRWVVQEIALARDAMITCGPDSISWKDFSVAVELFVEVETATHRLSEVMKKDPKFYHVPGWFEYVSALGASRLVEATGMIFRYYKPEDQPVFGTGDIRPGSRRDRQAGDGDAGMAADDSNDEEEPDRSSVEQAGSPGEGPRAGETSAAAGNESTEPAVTGGSPETEHRGINGNSRVGTSPGDDLGTDGTQNPGSAGNGVSGDGSRANTALVATDTEDEGADDPIANRRPLLNLEHLVSHLSIFQASEPRDAIYALLAIAKDAHPQARTNDPLSHTLARDTEQRPFLVDYGRAYAHVCWDFIEFCVTIKDDQSRALDILCRPWAPDAESNNSKHFHAKAKSEEAKAYWTKVRALIHKRGWKNLKFYFPRLGDQPLSPELKLPTWIPRLEGAPFSMFYQAGMDVMKVGRANADPLVGDPLLRRNYNAAQGRKVDLEVFSFKSRRLYNAHSMFVKGFILDTVQHVADSSQSGNIPAAWLQLGGWDIARRKHTRSKRDDKEADIPEPPEAFWRTLVADRGKDGQNPPYFYARACKECIAKGGVASGSVNTADLINNERNSIVAQFCRRVQAVIWNRSLIRTAQQHLGIANRHAKPRDLVAIVYGCSVPVILRRRMKSREQMEEEAREEEYTRKANIVWRALKAGIVRKKQVEKYEKLPEGTTTKEQQKATKKWHKGDVRAWRARYLQILEEKKQKDNETSNGCVCGSRGSETGRPLINGAAESHGSTRAFPQRGDPGASPLAQEQQAQSTAESNSHSAQSAQSAQPAQPVAPEAPLNDFSASDPQAARRIVHEPAPAPGCGTNAHEEHGPQDMPVGSDAEAPQTDASRQEGSDEDATSDEHIHDANPATSHRAVRPEPKDGASGTQPGEGHPPRQVLESHPHETSASGNVPGASPIPDPPPASTVASDDASGAATSSEHGALSASSTSSSSNADGSHTANPDGQNVPIAQSEAQHGPQQQSQPQSQPQGEEDSQRQGSNMYSQEPFYYEFLGECYIHGMMDGEAVRKMLDAKRDEKNPGAYGDRFVDMVFELR